MVGIAHGNAIVAMRRAAGVEAHSCYSAVHGRAISICDTMRDASSHNEIINTSQFIANDAPRTKEKSFSTSQDS